MVLRNAVVSVLLCALVGAGTVHAQEPAYGMLFHSPKAAPVAPSAPALELPNAPLASRPLTQADVDKAVANTQRPSAVVRTPSPSDLARMTLPSTPSAEPASFEQQQTARMAAWEAQEERRIEHERQVQAAQEAERNKPKVVVVQQQEPFLSNLLSIPRAIGWLFGGTVR